MFEFPGRVSLTVDIGDFLELAGAAADEFIAAVDGQDGVRGELLRGFRDKRIFAAPDLACHDQQRGVLTAFAVTVFV